MRLEPLNLYELEEHASRFISPHAWAFIEGGAQDEVTVKRNREALEAITLRPRFMQDVSNRDLSTTVEKSEPWATFAAPFARAFPTTTENPNSTGVSTKKKAVARSMIWGVTTPIMPAS